MGWRSAKGRSCSRKLALSIYPDRICSTGPSCSVTAHAPASEGRTVAGDPACAVPLSGIGGIATRRDTTKFLTLSFTSLQVCTAVMHYGYRIVEDMIDGLDNWMDERGFAHCTDFIGKALPNICSWRARARWR